MRRFFIGEPLSPEITISGQDFIHISRVLRMQHGDEIIAVGADGVSAKARIKSIGNQTVTAEITERLEMSHEPDVDVWLAQGLPKSDKMDFIVQKAVEIGASGVIPMETEHCMVKYDRSKQQSRVERWRKIAVEASKQCCREIVPQVSEIKTLEDVLNEVQPGTSIIMLYEKRVGEGLKEILRRCASKYIMLLVGPEGGFSPAELNLCRERGVEIASIGPRILRTETAALAALAVSMYEKGDLG